MLSARRQKLLIFMCFLLYVFSYIGRYSYSSNIVAICDDYGITKSVAGLVTTFFFISYGVGQFINGVLCKKYNKKYVLTVALTISAIINLVVFFKPPFAIFKYLWLVNGIALATMWPSLICILGDSIDDKYLHKAIIVMNTTVAFGTAIIYSISSICNRVASYNITFLISSILCLSLAIVWFIFCKNDIGKAKVELRKETTLSNKEREVTIKKASFYILYLIIMFAILSVIVNLFKDGTATWVPTILKETFGYPDDLSIILTLVLPVLGILGSPVGIMLNKKTKNYLLTLAILFGFTVLFTISIILSIINKLPVLILISFGFIALLTHSMNSIITGIAPLEERDKYPSGKMAGILNATSYIGSALSSFGLGALADNFDWTFIFYMFLVLVSISTLLATASGLILKRKQKKGA